MLRSLNTGISGLSSHQTMLDVTANNIANVNTTGFKGSQVHFQDTLSQLIEAGAAPGQDTGGSNPAQVGLGVQVAGIATNPNQGSTNQTGVGTHMMVNGEGFFVVDAGGQQAYTRAGAFEFNASGQLTDPSGALVQGWAAGAGGEVNTDGPLEAIELPADAALPPQPTTGATMGGNLPSDAEQGTELFRDVEVFDAQGNATVHTLTFTKTADGWDVTDGEETTPLNFTDGQLAEGTSIDLAGVQVDLSDVTGYADVSNLRVTNTDGRAAGSLNDFQVNSAGQVVGVYSNGGTEVLGQVALATFDNPGGLEKAGNSTYTATGAAGQPTVGAPGQNGAGSLSGGSLEMSNVDLSEEFTNLILAQRGFQASSRVITTSDEVLNEVVNLKR